MGKSGQDAREPSADRSVLVPAYPVLWPLPAFMNTFFSFSNVQFNTLR